MNLFEKIKNCDVRKKLAMIEFASVTVTFSLILVIMKMGVQSYKLQIWRINGEHVVANWWILKHGVVAFIMLALLFSLIIVSDKMKKELQFQNEIEEI